LGVDAAVYKPGVDPLDLCLPDSPALLI